MTVSKDWKVVCKSNIQNWAYYNKSYLKNIIDIDNDIITCLYEYYIYPELNLHSLTKLKIDLQDSKELIKKVKKYLNDLAKIQRKQKKERFATSVAIGAMLKLTNNKEKYLSKTRLKRLEFSLYTLNTSLELLSQRVNFIKITICFLNALILKALECNQKRKELLK